MLHKTFILFLVVTFSSLSVVGYASDTLVLNSLINEAKANNPEILAAKKRYEAAKARIPQAKSLDNPTVGISFEKIPKGTLKLNKTMSEDRMLSISQMFPLFGKLSLKAKIALVESQMAASEYKSKELEIVNNVKNAYYDLFLNLKEIELNQGSLELLEAIVKVAQAKYSVGEISQEEIFKLNLEIAGLYNRIQNLEEEQSAKETKLNSLLNREPESPLGNPTLSEDTSFQIDVNSLYLLTLENQPELQVFSYAIERNKYAKSLAKRSFFPDLMAQITQRGISSASIGPWDLMLAFTLPLWFWTKQRYEVKEAIANLEEAKAAYQAMKNKALAEVKDLYAKIEISKNKINLYQTNLIPILEGSINSSLAAFRSGGSDFMMLLDNERMLIETKMDYYKALVDYNMNLADLERALGLDLIISKAKAE
ncbi:MAG: TolC family protein [Candidatus Omnitrophota bacterium]